MLTLAIETSNPSASESGDAGSVAIARDDGSVMLRRVRPASRHDDALMATIDALVREAGAAPADIVRVAVSAGPGGFTALRIAITTAKMLAEAVGAQTVAVPTALVAAAGAPSDLGRVLPMLASKRGSAWGQIHERNAAGVMSPVEAGRLYDAAALAEAHRERPLAAVLADAHLPGPMRDWAHREGVPVLGLRLDATVCLLVSREIPATPPEALEPIYPREPEAVTKWRELGRST